MVVQIAFQIGILLTGNYNFFNLLTLLLMVPCWEEDRPPLPAVSTDLHPPKEGRGGGIWKEIDDIGLFSYLVSIPQLIQSLPLMKPLLLISSLLSLPISFLWMFRVEVEQHSGRWLVHLVKGYGYWEEWMGEWLPFVVFLIWCGGVVSCIVHISSSIRLSLKSTSSSFFTSLTSFGWSFFSTTSLSLCVIVFLPLTLLPLSQLHPQSFSTSGMVPQSLLSFQQAR